MTTIEFNEKYKVFLPKGWGGLEIDDVDVIVWLDNLFEYYLSKIEGFEYHQIKIKFGNKDIRFYSNLDYKNPVHKALQAVIESKISSILELKELKDNVSN